MSKRLKGNLKIVVLTLISVVAINFATAERGYRAVGGEFLLIPLIWGVRKIYLDLKEIFSK